MAKKNLNILMVAPLSVGAVNGGVRMQSRQTAAHLESMGVKVTLYNPWESYDLDKFDLAHLFIAGLETSGIAEHISDSACKLVVSPVFYTQKSATTIKRYLSIESIGRKLFNGFISDLSIKKRVCRLADLILPNTEAEAHLIQEGFRVKKNKLRVIPNGVDLRFADADPTLFQSKYPVRNFALFVGNASSPRKNLLPLLKQLRPDDPPFVIIGHLSNSNYSRSCREIIEASENIHHLGEFENSDPMLASAYAAADLFILPSIFETPGISAMEAALAGSEIAITEVGGTKEVFGNHAIYINPQKKESIIEGYRNGIKAAKSEDLRKHIEENYSWQRVALKTLEAYREL